MSRHTARIILDQIQRRPAMVAPFYITDLPLHHGEVTSVGLMADIREMARADVDTEQKWAERRKLELAMTYAGLIGAPPVQDKPFAFAGGKAIVPVHGVLINRFPYSWSFATGYNFVQGQVNAAMDDGDVDGIIYDVNSYGGLVSGCQETSDLMFAASAKQGGKPSLAVVDSSCYSAAYYLASAADRIAITPSGGAGSVGVLLMHLDVSKALDEFGIKVTFIHAGEHKVDGNMFEPLSREVTSDLQAEIDKMYGRFVSTVARNRPSLSEKAVRATEARSYQADDALALGLVDTVQTPSDALQRFFDASGPNEDTNMATTPAQTTDNGTGAKPAADDAAAAAATVRTAERDRIRAIRALPEAEGRNKLADHIALETDMTAEQAKGILAASPKDEKKEVTTKEPNHFKAAMDSGAHPNVGADQGGGDGTGDGDKPNRAQQILAAQQKATGHKPVIEGKAA